MFLAYLLLVCFSFDLNLARRAKKITFNGKSSISQRSFESSWYFVKLNFFKDNSPSFTRKIMNKLREQGISLKSSNYINKNVYSLYLTPSQVNFILSNDYGEAYELQSDIKLINSPDDDWTILTVEASNSKDLINDYSTKLSDNKCKFKFYFSTESMFSVSGPKECLNSLANTLIQDKRVYSVAHSKQAEVLNTRASGFAQKNTYEAKSVVSDIDGSHIIDVDRFLNNQGLDGTGITILVSDTYLDTNSTFFYDPQCPNVEYNKFITNHRKISYISGIGNETAEDGEHGTHTAGTVAGRALNASSTISKYNGGAYGSKLAFYTSNSQSFVLDKIIKTVDIVKPHISTNSWGILEQDTAAHDKIWDEAAISHNDTLFIFAAGNSGLQKTELQGFQTLRSPGSAKNVLTVGAIEAVSIDEKALGPDNFDIYLFESSTLQLEVLKLFEWSVKNKSLNTGLNNLFNEGKIKVSFTRDQSNIKNTTVLIIDGKTQFDELSKENPPYFVASTSEFEIDNFYDLGFIRTFPVMFIKNESIPKYEIDLIANYRTNKTYYKADFSSQGTGNHGIMKPDIMCPGVNIFSAKSVVNGTADHKEMIVKFGTSMATPICAGAAALVYQYFLEGKYRQTPLNLSSQLARSFMINSADPLTSIHPNAVNGYGAVNLGKYIGNGVETDNSRIIISDHNKISEDHLMSTVSLVKSSDVDFRITLSYLDSTFSSDSSSALVADIDLIVVSPSGTVYRGNQHEDNLEEHYSTNEKIIIKPDEIEEGDYEIHVFTAIPDAHPELRDIIEFAVTIFGPLGSSTTGQNTLKFEKATKCIPLDGPNGECNSETTMNECDSLRFGRSCQVASLVYDAYFQHEVFRVPAYGISYVTVMCPYEVDVDFITYRITPASMFDLKIAVFLDPDDVGSESDADQISDSGSHVLTLPFDPYLVSENVAVIMITNPSPFTVDVVFSYETSKNPTSPPTSEPTKQPTSEPTKQPTSEPTKQPTSEPTKQPTSEPTKQPTSEPTKQPAPEPTSVPSVAPSYIPNENNDNVVSKTSFLIVSSIAIIFGLIMISLIVFILVLLIKARNSPDSKSGVSMAGLSQSLL